MNGKSNKWSGMGKKDGQRDGQEGAMKGELAIGCVLEQIEADTHPQQDGLTPGRKQPHTHKHAKMQTHS